MIRRPKIQFKPKIQSSGEKKTSSPNVNKTTPTPQTPVSAAVNTTAVTPPIASQVEPSVTTTSIRIVDVSDGTDGALLDTQTIVELVTEPNSTSSTTHVNILVEEPIATSITSHELVFETTEAVSDASTIKETPAAKSTASNATKARPANEKKRVTLAPKETPAALTIKDSKKGLSSSSSTRKKPKICLSSSKVKLPEDRSKVTMYDLLSYNPPMSEEQKEKRRKAEEEAELMSMRSSAGSPMKQSTITTGRTSASETGSILSSSSPRKESSVNASSGPRVKIGADGKIVVDEESLIVERHEMSDVEEIVYEGSGMDFLSKASSTTYSSFRYGKDDCNAPKKSRWTPDDTVKFYRALSAVGTDFTLMANVIFKGSRNRVDLRNKFKREEKINGHLINKALRSMDLSLLDELEQESTDNEDSLQKNKIATPIIPEGETAAEICATVANNQENQEETSTTKSPRKKKRKQTLDENHDDESFQPAKRSARGLSSTSSGEEGTFPLRRSLRSRKQVAY